MTIFVQSRGSFDLLLEPGGRLSFQYLHDVRHGVAGCREQHQMYVIFLNTQFDDLPVLPFADLLEYSSHFVLDLVGRQYLPSVLRRPHKVVLQVVKTV